MLLDIVGYTFMAVFYIFGFIVMLWMGLVAIATMVAVIGAILQDLGIIKKS